MWDTELNQMIRYKAAHSGGETAAQTLGRGGSWARKVIGFIYCFDFLALLLASWGLQLQQLFIQHHYIGPYNHLMCSFV